jgi:hypothetical protein
MWIDFSCIKQNEDPPVSWKQLDLIMQCCDCVITPIVDAEESEYYPSATSGDFLRSHYANAWNVGRYSYLSAAGAALECSLSLFR